MNEIVRVENLAKVFPGRGRRGLSVQAVQSISFSVAPGEALGLVGESGSGKTTTGRIICGLEKATAGTVSVAGFDLSSGAPPPRAFYGRVQMVFQDPYSSLSPRMQVGDSIGYALKIAGVDKKERHDRVLRALARVGLPFRVAARVPHELSTGQRQRVGIARAIIVNPELIVADEPVSSLDVSLQSQIINLLADIQDELKISVLLVSHDLAVVSSLCRRVIVMQNGSIVEEGETATVFRQPADAYTQLLIEAAGIGESLAVRSASSAP